MLVCGADPMLPFMRRLCVSVPPVAIQDLRNLDLLMGSPSHRTQLYSGGLDGPEARDFGFVTGVTTIVG